MLYQWLFLLVHFVIWAHGKEGTFTVDNLRFKVVEKLTQVQGKHRPLAEKLIPQVKNIFTTKTVAVSHRLLQKLDNLQTEYLKMRAEQAYFVHEELWALWSCSYQQAVLYDRLARISGLVKGRAHVPVYVNFEKTLLLLASAFLSSLNEKDYPEDSQMVLKRLSLELIDLMKEFPGTVGVINALQEYDNRQWYSPVIENLIFYFVVFTIIWLLIDHYIFSKDDSG